MAINPNANPHPETVSATQAARSLSDLLNRVQYLRERFIIVRNGEPIAELMPPSGDTCTIGDFVRLMAELPALDSGFADDVAAIKADQPPLPRNRWEF